MTSRQLLIVVALFACLVPGPVVADARLQAAGGRADVERHLAPLERGAVRLGPTADDTTVRIVLGFTWRKRAALEQFVAGLDDPHSPRYQQFLTSREFARRFAPRAAQVAAAARFLRRQGLRVVEIAPSRLQVTAEGPAVRVAQVLGTSLLEIRDSHGVHTVTAEAPQLPEELGAQVVAVGSAAMLEPPGDGPARAAIAAAPFAPDGIARLYGFDTLYANGVRGAEDRRSTIAIATAFDFDPDDLAAFWSAHGIARERSSVELIPVAGTQPPPAVSATDRMETTLDVEWASSMAPGARVLVYAGSDAMSTTLLRTYDRIVTDNRAAVLTTSWGRCESDYPRSYLNQVDAVLLRAAAQGITVIAASGDGGAFACGGDTPGVSFPASHPFVLAVGGTALTRRGNGFDETAWPGSGGGTSVRFAAPPWQMHPSAQRAMADVAFNADLGSGYLMLSDGGWLVAGGTSVGAPIWASLVALTNQARATAGRPTLGLAAPQLCELAAATSLAPTPFVDVVAGDNGAFAAAPGWDCPTGWGSPRADALVDALAHWTPSPNGRDGVATIMSLAATESGVDGAVRMRFQRRCMITDIDMHARGLQAGHYTLFVDGTPVASFDTDSRGGAILSVPQVDLRGRRVQLTDDTGEVRFTLSGDTPPDSGDEQLSAALTNTGMVIGARGTVLYRGGGGREQLTVQTQMLPAGSYDVRLGAETIGTLKVNAAATEVTARFDTLGMSGAPLAVSPLCKPLLVVRAGSAYLRGTADALTPGECSDGQRADVRPSPWPAPASSAGVGILTPGARSGRRETP